MLALVDANSFYCSAERVFRPDLNGRAVVVLSNNDGCVVSRTSEAKVLGVPMGAPWFQLRDQARRSHWDLTAFSSNYTLYGDMSRRFMSVLAQFVPPEDQSVYSIDESFLDFSKHTHLHPDATALGHTIRDRVRVWTGLPVCVGFGGTQTLAKMANHIAKKQPRWMGVCDLTALAEPALHALLSEVPVGDVWGIGRRLSAQLIDGGISTAADLRAADPKRLRERFSVVVERTVRELQGARCLGWETEPPAKKQIISSRSFGAPLYTADDLMAPVHAHAARAAEKARAQGSVAGRVGVWLTTNPFRPQDPQHTPSRSVALPSPSADTAVLAAWSTALLRSIVRPGYRYVKAGVVLDDLRPHTEHQGSLFDAPRPGRAAQADRVPSRGEEWDAKRAQLMHVLDTANIKWGSGHLGVGWSGIRAKQDWSMKRDMLSPCYTTNWDEVRAVS